jgi:hypothetical protein
MDLQINQVHGKLPHVSFKLDFESDAQTNRRDSRHGVLVTDHYKPRRDQRPTHERTIHRERVLNPSAPTPLGSACLPWILERGNG